LFYLTTMFQVQKFMSPNNTEHDHEWWVCAVCNKVDIACFKVFYWHTTMKVELNGLG
jgi:hypothetical protein